MLERKAVQLMRAGKCADGLALEQHGSRSLSSFRIDKRFSLQSNKTVETIQTKQTFGSLQRTCGLMSQEQRLLCLRGT